MAEKIAIEANENGSSFGVRVRYHYGFYGRLKKGVGKTQEFNLGISELYERVSAAGRPIPPSREEPHRDIRINPGESYDSGFIHAGALVHAPE